MACIGQSRDAKRTAVAHSVFNITGAFLFIWFVPVLASFVQLITPGPELDVIARQIANAHTTFNVVCTLLWLPLIGVMVKIVTFLVPGKADGRRTPPSSPSTTRSSVSRCSPSGCSARSCRSTATRCAPCWPRCPRPSRTGTPPRSRRSKPIARRWKPRKASLRITRWSC
ncbi:MAG: Na/Pi symporter [Eggerthella lenta]